MHRFQICAVKHVEKKLATDRQTDTQTHTQTDRQTDAADYYIVAPPEGRGATITTDVELGSPPWTILEHSDTRQ